MRILKQLGFNKKSAQTAKDRLHIIIAQQRSENTSPDYLPLLRQEIMAVIAKYTKTEEDDINLDMNMQTVENNSVLELNIILPE